jgi:hypothetical protein
MKTSLPVFLMHVISHRLAVLWGIIVGFLFAFALLTFLPGNGVFLMRHMAKNYFTGDSVVFVGKTSLTARYIVPYVRLAEPGYVAVIYTDSFDMPGEEEDVAGYSRYLPAGIHRNIEISVNPVHSNKDFFVCLQGGDEWGMHGTLLDSTSSVVCQKVLQ